MSFLHRSGTMRSASVGLITGTPSASMGITPNAKESIDVYEVQINTNETALRTVTLSDGTFTVSYYVGGGAGGRNPSTIDDACVPIRFRPGQPITATASAVTGGTSIVVSVRAIVTAT